MGIQTQRLQGNDDPLIRTLKFCYGRKQTYYLTAFESSQLPSKVDSKQCDRGQTHRESECPGQQAKTKDPAAKKDTEKGLDVGDSEFSLAIAQGRMHDRQHDHGAVASGTRGEVEKDVLV